MTLIKFDPTKPCRTRDGHKVRVLASDLKSDGYPIAAAVTQDDGTESVYYYNAAGLLSSPATSPSDLVNLPEPPGALNLNNGVGVRIDPDNPAAIDIGLVKPNQWLLIVGTDAPALIQWLQAYLTSRQ